MSNSVNGKLWNSLFKQQQEVIHRPLGDIIGFLQGRLGVIFSRGQPVVTMPEAARATILTCRETENKLRDLRIACRPHLTELELFEIGEIDFPPAEVEP